MLPSPPKTDRRYKNNKDDMDQIYLIHMDDTINFNKNTSCNSELTISVTNIPSKEKIALYLRKQKDQKKAPIMQYEYQYYREVQSTPMRSFDKAE